MHIADGLLSLEIIVPLWIFVAIYGFFAIKKVKKNVTEDQIPLIGVLTAMIFAFQMLNFPVLAGTSGHLLGFVLMAILTAPSTAFLMISVVLLIQSLIFADGGILALGANIFNMGIVTLIGYFVYWIILKKFSREKSDKDEPNSTLLIGAFIGAYTSLIASSFVCGIEIGLSSSFPYGIDVTIPAMLFYHVLIGIGEGLITMMVVGFFQKFAPEYIPEFENIPIWS